MNEDEQMSFSLNQVRVAHPSTVTMQESRVMILIEYIQYIWIGCTFQRKQWYCWNSLFLFEILIQ